MARARLRDRHQENLLKKLQVLKAEQGVAEEREGENQPSTSSAAITKQETNSEEDIQESGAEENEEDNEE